jgi:two-component system chemotaxis response regulator CheY
MAMITLLIVDDSPIARQILRKCLPKESAFSIIEAADGQEALEKYRQYRPEITFMDMTMPVMDGFQAIAEIKQIDPQAIIIAATADVQQKARQRIIELGALMHLPKPVTPKAIRDALAKAEQALREQI